ncbi:extracellular matrix protein 1 [Misgurnus anguillicaudatus]|uniref:extracellular matrix protein 1 n=1 Tax=Misgurnus anguillicaudatus TaxID=75329 RepID=UPI0024358575|nr:extracellular matrix protein 1 [Misgurnus anguillicaudatus]
MGSSHGAGLCLILVLVFMCEATEDQQPHLQRPMIYDKDGLQREATPEELELMVQRPIIPDISDFIKLMASSERDMSQTENTNFHSEDIPRVPPQFGPRFMRPNSGPEIHFPPAFPSISNLEDICQFSKASVRYPEDIFPPSGFGHAHRQADAVNRLQGWYGVCCGIDGSEAEKICCAEQAWRKTLSAFCNEEFSIKTVADVCCQKKGKARWSCFDKEASATSYDIPILDLNVDIPRKVQGFRYKPSSCKG